MTKIIKILAIIIMLPIAAYALIWTVQFVLIILALL